jgi:hypothetical protein
MSDRLKNDREDAVKDKDGALQRGPSKKKSGKAKASVLAVFLLNKDGHRRAFPDDPQKSDEQFRRSLLYFERVKGQARHFSVPPRVELQTFNSFNDLIRKRPKGRGAKWAGAILLTHCTARPDADVARSGIWLGDHPYFASGPDPDEVIFEAIARANQKTLAKFQESILKPSELMIVCCGVGQTTEEVGKFMRDLFGTDGLVKIPNKRVALDKTTGALGVMVANSDDPEENNPTRPLRDNDWITIPAR